MRLVEKNLHEIFEETASRADNLQAPVVPVERNANNMKQLPLVKLVV